MLAQAVIKYHRMGDSGNKHLFSHSSGGWKSKIKVLSGLVSGEASSWLQMAPFSLCPDMASSLHVVGAISGISPSSYEVMSPIGLSPHPHDLSQP